MSDQGEDGNTAVVGAPPEGPPDPAVVDGIRRLSASSPTDE
jgi:hypothetical protein